MFTNFTYHQLQLAAKRPFESKLNCQKRSWLQNMPRTRDDRGLLALFRCWVAASIAVVTRPFDGEQDDK
jgi:hypothetical protein